MLTILARRHYGWNVRVAVATNPECPLDLRRGLATKDRSRTVRERAF
ncbi:hypothetical protein [Nonomuraea basaltis]|nr:hypothetical protein [Nonomuraea basaltis]